MPFERWSHAPRRLPLLFLAVTLIPVLALGTPTIPTRSLSADGRRIAFTGSTSKRELWVFRNLLSERAKAR